MDALEAYQSLDWPDGRDRSEQTVVEEGRFWVVQSKIFQFVR